MKFIVVLLLLSKALLGCLLCGNDERVYEKLKNDLDNCERKNAMLKVEIKEQKLNSSENQKKLTVRIEEMEKNKRIYQDNEKFYKKRIKELEYKVKVVNAGKALYARCVGCHGANGKTKAMGKSNQIAGQSAVDLETKLAAYKAGTLNTNGMGMLMKGQVNSLSEDDIKAVAAYMASF